MRKKIIQSVILLLSLGFFFSCTPDEKPKKKKSDIIVGDWERLQEVYVFENDSMVTNDFSECHGTSSIVFMDKVYDQSFHIYHKIIVDNNTTQPCQIIAGKGTWTKISQGKYSSYVEYYEDYDPYNIGKDSIFYDAYFPASDSLHLHNLNKLMEYQTKMQGLQDYYIIYKLDDGSIDYFPNLP